MKKFILSIFAVPLIFNSGYSQLNLVSNMNPGATSSIPDFLYVFNDKVYYTADDGTFGAEVWEYNGSASPQLDYEVNTSGSSATAGHFCEFNGKLCFSGYESVYGNELYEYDGINAPVRISDINPGSANSIPTGMTVFNGKLYFYGVGPGNDYEFYVYDGINPPSLVANINPTGNSFPAGFTEFNGKLYFSANDGVNGIELWEYDGTNPPTMLLDINPGTNNSIPQYFKVYNNKLYFNADNGVNGTEIWMYDGTNPPAMVVDMIAGSGSFDPRYFYVYNSKLIFSAIDAVAGNELWQYDGVNTPTLVFDINTNPSIGLHNSHPRHFIEYNNLLYFRAQDETHGRELWAWDGVNNPVFIVDINPGTAHSSEDWNLNTTKRMVVLNGKLILAADDGVVGEELFEYTGCLVNAAVTESNMIITATQSGASYQWIDCNTNTPISGETNQSFTATADGDYAVIVADGACIDTSVCTTILGLGLNNDSQNRLAVFPNPAQTNLTIEITEPIEFIRIFNSTGTLVQTEVKNSFPVENLPAGMYVLQVQTESGISTTRFVKE
ncbi:MAG: T9SS type A sorting domain-containing protein [Bacteroidetes bacterium]|nr:T9SS type A sorting domain-containing protein [Bacteroidota bacterium]